MAMVGLGSPGPRGGSWSSDGFSSRCLCAYFGPEWFECLNPAGIGFRLPGSYPASALLRAGYAVSKSHPHPILTTTKV